VEAGMRIAVAICLPQGELIATWISSPKRG
jgi:hypothetical protein